MPIEHIEYKKMNKLKDKRLQMEGMWKRHRKRYRAGWYAVANLSKEKSYN